MVMQSPRDQVRYVLILTLGFNLLVMAIKAGLGFWTGSLSLQADALHSVTDSANNVLGLLANRWSSPHPDREHPYGHQKFEAVGALGIAAFLGITCFEILRSAVTRLWLGTSPVNVSGGELWLLLLVLGINIFVAFYERRVGLRLDSPLLIADAKHTMSDVWVTIVVLAGMIGLWQSRVWDLPQLLWLDIVLAFPVALLVFRSGWEVLRDNLPWLVDEIAIAPEAIYQVTMTVSGVVNCHDIASRGLLGRQVFIEMHMIVEAQDVETAHEITEAVEQALDERFGPVRVLIHIEPPDYESEQISFGLQES
ncbi:cation diffusion facilitator family transporter [Spirulina major CS-329]|uniref:cation diffusion facilitator family transporter n=1 Tax=Spirulina TaxID=1154 RepID=UPI00232B34DB|nr:MULTISPECIES: cation diffusion facilitator family transporter [Spirulina]MDB9496789.1 cation diffusion facilitator family transporter [Spirulina subsalsa CS-330]MDB9502404.1 cation diffusion facilitator family transporter [Spirulina major CS-329]